MGTTRNNSRVIDMTTIHPLIHRINLNNNNDQLKKKEIHLIRSNH